MTEGLLALAIGGLVSFFKNLAPSNINGWVTVVLAVLLGAFAGWAGIEGLTVVSGVLSALAIVGGFSLVDRIKGS